MADITETVDIIGTADNRGTADMRKDDSRIEWIRSRDNLIRALTSLGFPEELGHAIAKHLGSPKAIDRMTAYLGYVKPKKAELVVDEMLAIRSEIDAWREKKASQEANMTYNEMLYRGWGPEED